MYCTKSVTVKNKCGYMNQLMWSDIYPNIYVYYMYIYLLMDYHQEYFNIAFTVTVENLNRETWQTEIFTLKYM